MRVLLSLSRDSKKVGALIEMILHAHVDQQYQEPDSATCFIAFYLDDGTAVTRV